MSSQYYDDHPGYRQQSSRHDVRPVESNYVDRQIRQERQIPVAAHQGYFPDQREEYPPPSRAVDRRTPPRQNPSQHSYHNDEPDVSARPVSSNPRAHYSPSRDQYHSQQLLHPHQHQQHPQSHPQDYHLPPPPPHPSARKVLSFQDELQACPPPPAVHDDQDSARPSSIAFRGSSDGAEAPRAHDQHAHSRSQSQSQPRARIDSDSHYSHLNSHQNKYQHQHQHQYQHQHQQPSHSHPHAHPHSHHPHLHQEQAPQHPASTLSHSEYPPHHHTHLHSPNKTNDAYRYDGSYRDMYKFRNGHRSTHSPNQSQTTSTRSSRSNSYTLDQPAHTAPNYAPYTHDPDHRGHPTLSRPTTNPHDNHHHHHHHHHQHQHSNHHHHNRSHGHSGSGSAPPLSPASRGLFGVRTPSTSSIKYKQQMLHTHLSFGGHDSTAVGASDSVHDGNSSSYGGSHFEGRTSKPYNPPPRIQGFTFSEYSSKDRNEAEEAIEAGNRRTPRKNSEAASYRNKNFYGVNPILQDHEVDEKNRGLKKTSWANRSQVGVYVGFDLSSYYKGDPRLIKMKKKQNGWHGANDDLKGAGGKNMRGEHKENNNTGHGDEFEFGYGFDGDDDERINKLSRGKAKKPVYDSSRAGVHTTENYGRLKHKRVLGTQLQESNGKSKTTRKKGCSQRRIYTSQIVIG